MSEIERIPVDQVVIRESLYPRAEINRNTALRYSEALDNLPPILVRRSDYALVDGAHRIEAHRIVGAQDIAAEMLDDCDDRELFRMALRLNASHGLQLSRQDKMRLALSVYSERATWETRAEVKRELAEDLAVPVRTIARWVEPKELEWKADLVSAARDMETSGRSQARIALDLGLTRGAVRTLLKSGTSGEFSQMADPASRETVPGYGLTAHPLSLGMPPMREPEYMALKRSLAQQGWWEGNPLVMLDGMILDGNHRYRAAAELGMDPETIPAIPLPAYVPPCEVLAEHTHFPSYWSGGATVPDYSHHVVSAFTFLCQVCGCPEHRELKLAHRAADDDSPGLEHCYGVETRRHPHPKPPAQDAPPYRMLCPHQLEVFRYHVGLTEEQMEWQANKHRYNPAAAMGAGVNVEGMARDFGLMDCDAGCEYREAAEGEEPAVLTRWDYGLVPGRKVFPSALSRVVSLAELMDGGAVLCSCCGSLLLPDFREAET